MLHRRLPMLDRVGVLVVAGLGVLAGCGPVREQFPDRRFAREHVPTPPTEPVFAPELDQNDVNNVQLAGLPVKVQASFRRQHPGVGITSVRQVPSGTGPMLYRIGFVEGGAAQSVTYGDAGVDQADSASARVFRDESDGRPPIQYAPAKSPTTRGTAPGSVD